LSIINVGTKPIAIHATDSNNSIPYYEQYKT
jgi:hypothetical protein